MPDGAMQVQPTSTGPMLTDAMYDWVRAFTGIDSRAGSTGPGNGAITPTTMASAPGGAPVSSASGAAAAVGASTDGAAPGAGASNGGAPGGAPAIKDVRAVDADCTTVNEALAPFVASKDGQRLAAINRALRPLDGKQEAIHGKASVSSQGTEKYHDEREALVRADPIDAARKKPVKDPKGAREDPHDVLTRLNALATGVKKVIKKEDEPDGARVDTAREKSVKDPKGAREDPHDVLTRVNALAASVKKDMENEAKTGDERQGLIGDGG